MAKAWDIVQGQIIRGEADELTQKMVRTVMNKHHTDMDRAAAFWELQVQLTIFTLRGAAEGS